MAHTSTENNVTYLDSFPALCSPCCHTQLYCTMYCGRYWCCIISDVVGHSICSVLQGILLFVFSSPRWVGHAARMGERCIQGFGAET